MNSYLSRLNPAERRFVIIVALVFFLVINIFWVWPHFSDWGNLKNRLDKAQVTQGIYETAIAQMPATQREIEKLTGQGINIPPEDQAIQFLRTIQTQAAQSGVGFTGNSQPRTSTNQFFIKQSQTVSVVSGEKQLVDFLYNLGSGNSLVQVLAMSVHPDAARQQLNASLTLVASYQITKAKTRASASKPAVPATPPATIPAAQPPAPPIKPPAPATLSPVPKAATPNKK